MVTEPFRDIGRLELQLVTAPSVPVTFKAHDGAIDADKESVFLSGAANPQ